MMQEMHDTLERVPGEDDETPVTPQGTPDTGAPGVGGTPARRGNTRREVARKSGSPRAAGRGSKQPTKRTSGQAKAKRAAAKKTTGTRKAAAKKGAGAARKAAAKKGAGAARKAAATKSTAKRRIQKTGAARKRVRSRP